MQEREETRVQSLVREDPLEKGTAAHSSILAWRIPRTEEPGGLQSIAYANSQTQLTQHEILSCFSPVLLLIFESSHTKNEKQQ